MGGRVSAADREGRYLRCLMPAWFVGQSASLAAEIRAARAMAMSSTEVMTRIGAGLSGMLIAARRERSIGGKAQTLGSGLAFSDRLVFIGPCASKLGADA